MTDLDRISELPNDLKVKVLVRLPIKEAAKTSCLSSKWRYAWTYIPDLVFTEATVNLTGDSSATASRLTNIVDIVLLLHQGPIRKFMLECDHVYLNDAIYRWMLILSRNKIRDLNINLTSDYHGGMPSSLFSISSLTDVCLENCYLELPRSFNGLELLKTLQLRYCIIGEKELENLISSCPNLESLELIDMDGLSVRIRAPKLKHIRLVLTASPCIYLITPILVDATLNLTLCSVKNGCKNILKDVFGSLCNLERLSISSFSMRDLACAGNLQLPIKLACLKKLVLSMDASDQKENALAVSMFRNAPCLETLKIFHMGADTILTETFRDPTMQMTSFLNLKVVEIGCLSCTVDFTLPLVEFILATSPVLLSLHLASPGAENAICLKKLLSFKRASKDAQIFVDSSRRIPTDYLSHIF